MVPSAPVPRQPAVVLASVVLASAILMWSACASAADCPHPSAASANALGTSRILPVDPAATPRVGLMHFPATLPLAEKEVVLTFDDGPLAATTTRVLAALAKECVHATFFLIGRNAAADPALVRKIAEAGHTIGSHTMQHRILNRVPEAAALRDIDDGIAAIGRALDAKPPVAPFFRFPGFASNPPLLDKVAARKLAVFGADLWVSDWNPMTPAQELSQLTGRLAAAKRGIILMHDTRGATVAMLPLFLRYLKANGYKVVHVVPRQAAVKDTVKETAEPPVKSGAQPAGAKNGPPNDSSSAK